MNKIPQRFELDEDDIRDAITDWLNNHEDTNLNGDDTFTISFETTEKRARPTTGPIGGMTDDVVTIVVSAVAVLDD